MMMTMPQQRWWHTGMSVERCPVNRYRPSFFSLIFNMPQQQCLSMCLTCLKTQLLHVFLGLPWQQIVSFLSSLLSIEYIETWHGGETALWAIFLQHISEYWKLRNRSHICTILTMRPQRWWHISMSVEWCPVNMHRWCCFSMFIMPWWQCLSIFLTCLKTKFFLACLDSK